MVIISLLATILVAHDQPLVSANAGRPSICVSAWSADGEPAAETKDLADSVRDLERALRSLERKHQFAVPAAADSCIVTLQVQRRVEDEEEEAYTVVARLTATTRAGQNHHEELTATEGSWRGAASAIAGKVGFFVDSNRTSLAGAPAASASSTATPSTVASSTPSAVRAPASARTVEDGILDWVRLTDEGGRTMQTPVYMRLFTSEKADLGTGGDGGKETRASEAKTVQGQGPTLLRDSFMTRASGVGLKASALEEGATLPSSAVIVEGEFVTIDPGSRTKRYFVGFGAGKSAIEIAGRIRSATGTVIAEFRHRRIGAMGIAGGDSLGKLLADTRSCGEDLARFVEAWLANKSLK